jgi:multiple sugar transport system permease protein/alpha-1,4-digalacturonate transport system permease protein
MVALVVIFPIYWMFATAVRPRSEIFEPVVGLLPSSLTWRNFTAVWARYPLLTWVTNSLIIAIVAVVLTVFINLLCGYTFAKFRFPGRNLLFFAILGALMVPIQVIVVPEFLIVSWLGLLNQHLV